MNKILKHVLFLTFFTSIVIVAKGTTYTSLGGAVRAWETATDWVGNNNPGTSAIQNDRIKIAAGDSLIRNGNLSFKNGDTLVISGILTITGDLTVQNNLVLIVTGKFYVLGNLDVQNNADFSVSGSGTMDVTGDATFKNGTTGTVNGNLTVGGNFNVGSGTVTGTGTIDAPSSTICSDPNVNVSTCGDSNNPLPVDVIYFRGELKDQIVQLSWATSMEKDFNFFTIERAGKDLNFHKLEKVYSKTGYSDVTRTYKITDELPLPGLSYYRLKATDFNGTFKYHGIVAMHGEDNGDAMRLYPNPVSGRDVTLDYSSTSPATYQVVSLSGEPVDYGHINPGRNSINFHITLEPGIYIVRVEGNRPVKPVKLIVR